jgi:hypothetical protein
MQPFGISLGDYVASRRAKPDSAAARIDADSLANPSGEIMLPLVI